MGQEGREGGVNGTGNWDSQPIGSADIARRSAADLYGASSYGFHRAKITLGREIIRLTVVVAM
jgi:hypothetical protein